MSAIKFMLVFLISSLGVVPWVMAIPARADSSNPDRSTVPDRSSGGGHYASSRGQVPGRYRGGGRRGGVENLGIGGANRRCPSALVPLTAVASHSENVASNGLPVTYVGGVTTLAQPSFWFYVPYRLNSSLNGDLTAEFILQDDTEKIVYNINSVNFPATERTPGLVEIALPSTVELQVGATYRWYFKINCEAESSIYTEGGIERIPLDPTLSQQLATASPQQKAALYQSNGIWYDAIATLASVYRIQPNEPAIAADWHQLLQAINIVDIPDTSSQDER